MSICIHMSMIGSDKEHLIIYYIITFTTGYFETQTFVIREHWVGPSFTKDLDMVIGRDREQTRDNSIHNNLLHKLYRAESKTTTLI